MYEKTILSNGARIVTESIPSVRSVAVGVWIHTGSRDEEHSLAGISHFIEHMVFKGTARRRMHEIARRLESVGGYLNAFTGKEYTCFHARALDAHLERAIETTCDLILQPLFPEKEMAKEKAVVLEEMKMYEDSPEDVVFDRFERAVYKDHALGRPIVGFPETVSALSQQDLFQFVDRRYTPECMVLSVSGNVQHARVVRLAEKAFRDSDRKRAECHRTSVGDYRAGDIVEERPIQQAHLVLGRRGIDINHAMRTTATVLNTILGGGMSSRLNQNIRERYGYCYNIFSFLNFYSDTGDIGVYMGTDPAHLAKAKKLIRRELDKLVQRPVSKRALNQAKNQVKGHIMLGLESMSNRMIRIARQELLLGRYVTLDEVLDELDKVSSDGVQEAAQLLYASEQFSSVALLPVTERRKALAA